MSDAGVTRCPTCDEPTILAITAADRTVITLDAATSLAGRWLLGPPGSTATFRPYHSAEPGHHTHPCVPEIRSSERRLKKPRRRKGGRV